MTTKLTLIHGDCTEVLPTLERESVDLIFTDPPFNAGFSFANDNIPEAQFWLLMAKWLTEALAVLKPDGQMYVKFSTVKTWKLTLLAEKLGYKYENTIIWDKQIYPKRYGYRNWTYSYEPILVFSKGNGIRLNKPTPNILRVKPCYYKRNEYNKRDFIVQTPLEVPHSIISAATKTGATVLDCFLGSGTTLLACKMLERNGIGIELEAQTVELAKRRLEWGMNPIQYEFVNASQITQSAGNTQSAPSIQSVANVQDIPNIENIHSTQESARTAKKTRTKEDAYWIRRSLEIA